MSSITRSDKNVLFDCHGQCRICFWDGGCEVQEHMVEDAMKEVETPTTLSMAYIVDTTKK